MVAAQTLVDAVVTELSDEVDAMATQLIASVSTLERQSDTTNKALVTNLKYAISDFADYVRGVVGAEIDNLADALVEYLLDQVSDTCRTPLHSTRRLLAILARPLIRSACTPDEASAEGGRVCAGVGHVHLLRAPLPPLAACPPEEPRQQLGHAVVQAGQKSRSSGLRDSQAYTMLCGVKSAGVFERHELVADACLCLWRAEEL